MKYKVTITGIGDFVLQYMQTRNSMIIFDEDVPYEFVNMVAAHTKGTLQEDIKVGDKLHIADTNYTVSAVGTEASATLRSKGHCTLVFNGSDKVAQPGQIALKGNNFPRIMVGDIIEFE